MGLFNRLFGSKSDIAKEIEYDVEERINLWEKYLEDYPKREELSRSFSFANIDNSLKDRERLTDVLNQILVLTSEDIITIGKEIKEEDEILADLKKLNSGKRTEALLTILGDELSSELEKQKAVKAIFMRLYKVLKTELHLIRIVLTNPDNVRELLIVLFRLIYNQEAMLRRAFLPDTFNNKEAPKKIKEIARSLILEERLKKEVQSDEEKFIYYVSRIMSNEESAHHFRKLAENIFVELAHEAGAPILPEEDVLKLMDKIRELKDNDNVLFRIVKNERPKYDDLKIRQIMAAFRKAFDLSLFEDQQAEFFT